MTTLFDTLRLAAGSEFVRAAINDIKGQIEGMDWDVTQTKGEKMSPALQAQADAVKAWLKRPNPKRPWSLGTTINSWLEEILVTDALTILPRWDRAGKFIGLEQLDGPSIKPCVDARGAPPEPGYRVSGRRVYAYEQWAFGRPETGFDVDTGTYPAPNVDGPNGPEISSPLWYCPRNPRGDAPYGRSEVETLILTINLAMRQQIQDLGYYTDRTLPEGLYQIDEWPAEKIAEFQKNFDQQMLVAPETLSGRLIFVPKGSYQATKTREWDYEFFESYMRLVAWVFQVSPASIAKQSGLGGSQSATLETSVAESGTRPKAEFVAGIITRAIQGPMGFPDLEFQFGSDETEDSAVTFERHKTYVSIGAITLNELRQEEGRDPYDPEIGDRPFVMTGVGPVYLDDVVAGEAGIGQQREQVADDDPEAADRDRAQADDLARWQKVAVKLVKEGKPFRKFESAAISPLVSVLVQRRLDRAVTVDDVRAAFAGMVKKKPPTFASRHNAGRTASSGGPS